MNNITIVLFIITLVGFAVTFGLTIYLIFKKCQQGCEDLNMKIELTLSCFAPTIIMEVEIPQDRDAEEYIDELLESILAEEFRYNAEWDFIN